MRKRKEYRVGPNPAEFKFEELCDSRKISFSRRGYPDYVVLRNGEIYGFIEVKPHNKKKLRKGQTIFADFCKRYGIPFAIWVPGNEFPEWF